MIIWMLSVGTCDCEHSVEQRIVLHEADVTMVPIPRLLMASWHGDTGARQHMLKVASQVRTTTPTPATTATNTDTHAASQRHQTN